VSISGPSGPAGATGSQGSVATLSTGTYSIGVLYANTLTVTGVGAFNITSGNDINLKASGQVTVNAPFVLTTSTTAGLSTLGLLTRAGALVYVTDAVGGAQPAFFNGTNWFTINGRTQIA
jgi:hypothetical protein